MSKYDLNLRCFSSKTLQSCFNLLYIATPMPWPGDYCDGVTQDADLVADPNDCHCFYQCSYEHIQGHKCCNPGLAFNVVTGTCDWEYNVPDCSS